MHPGHFQHLQKAIPFLVRETRCRLPVLARPSVAASISSAPSLANRAKEGLSLFSAPLHLRTPTRSFSASSHHRNASSTAAADMATAPLTLPSPAAVTKILVVGGSYAGLSATVNLLDLGNHLRPRMVYPSYKHTIDAPRTPVEITLVDERDGFCMSHAPHSYITRIISSCSPFPRVVERPSCCSRPLHPCNPPPSRCLCKREGGRVWRYPTVPSGHHACSSAAVESAPSNALYFRESLGSF